MGVFSRVIEQRILVFTQVAVKLSFYMPHSKGLGTVMK